MSSIFFDAPSTLDEPLRNPSFSLDPREEMDRRLPQHLQPFMTWLTAKPSSSDCRSRTPIYHVVTAFFLLALGTAMSIAVLCVAEGIACAALLPIALILTTSGMGKLQAVVYHHCAHGTVFRNRALNSHVGRAIGILLLVKHFDAYQREHMLHHNPKKLLTDDDEFAQFVFNLCGLRLGLPKNVIWRHVLLSFLSPFFHLRFLLARISSNLLSRSVGHNIAALTYWSVLLWAVSMTDLWSVFLIAWLLPLVVLFQLATALRVFCEHRFPEAEIIALRDKRFVGHATTGVFAGAAPPAATRDTWSGLWEWTIWWMRMLTLHLFERVFVLVGDAPAHDFHHRHPASRKWANYIYAREEDRQAGCPGYPVNYIESWGLFRTIDENFVLMSRAAMRPAD